MKYFYIFCIILLSVFELKSQQRSSGFTFGSSGLDRAKLIHALTPENSVICGETMNPVSDEKVLFLANVSTSGKANWYKTYGGKIPYAVNDWLVTQNGEFVLSAEQYYQDDRETLYLMKLDNQGTIQWSTLFNEGGNEVEGLSIAQAKDGGYIITGLVKVSSIASDVFYTIKQEKQYLYLLKTDSRGKKEWSKKFNYDSPNSEATGNKIRVVENGFLITGYITEDRENKNSDILLMKVDFNGNFLWAKAIGGLKDENVKNMEVLNGSIFVVGLTNSFGNQNNDGFVAELNENGILKWFNTYGGSKDDALTSISIIDKNKLLVAGETYSYRNGVSNLMTLIIDKQGRVLSSTLFGKENFGVFGSIDIQDSMIHSVGSMTTTNYAKSHEVWFTSQHVSSHINCLSETLKITATNHTVSQLTSKNLTSKMLSDVRKFSDKKEEQIDVTFTKSNKLILEPLCK